MDTINENKIKLDVDISKQFAYVDYHADCLLRIKDDSYVTNYSFVKRIGIINHTDFDYNDLVIKVVFFHPAFKMCNINISIIEEYEEIFVKIPFLNVDKKQLDDITEPLPSTVMFELYEGDKIIDSKEYSFIILPISNPSNLINEDNRLYSKFITPLDEFVKQVTLNARKLYGNDIIAYQNNDRNIMLNEINSLYKALHNWGIAYQNPPASGFQAQRLRMPREVLIDKKGTCIDLSILFCACLEELGYKSILIIIDNHAFAGVFLKKNLSFANGIEHQCSRVYNLATKGVNDICLVECTALTASNSISFVQSTQLAVEKIKNYNKEFQAIDVNLCHSEKMVFSPIPVINGENILDILMDPIKLNSEKVDDIAVKNYVEVLKYNNQDRFSIWERKLLDLTEINQLVSFKMNLKNTLKISANGKLYELLENNTSLKISCIPQDTFEISIEDEFKKYTAKPKEIFGNLYDENILLAIGHEKTLKDLIKKSNSAMDETGALTLYLCLGKLTYTLKKGNKPGYAPFMVLPIKITKDRLTPTYTMSYDFDDLMINQTFFEYYKQDHENADFSILYNAVNNYDYMDIVHTFKKNNVCDIKLDEEEYFIGNLTFANYIMWQDIKKRRDELKKSKVIQSILEDKNLLDDNVSSLDMPIDEAEKYHDFAAPLPYDSTQLRAILKCAEGKSFILDGPPGTGKSQTIVNMIVNAFYHGKTVLFVAEKKAALDVVADRLKKLGDPNSPYNLGRFCLELHSNKASKTQFFGKLKESMELGLTKDAADFELKCNELEERKNYILKIINKMHERKYHYSLYDSIVINNELIDYDLNIEFDEEFLTNLNDDLDNKIFDLIDKYISSSAHIIDFDFSPIKLLKLDNLNFYDKEKLINDFNNTKKLLDEFMNSYNDLASKLNIKYTINDKSINNIIKILNICLNKEIYVDTIVEFLKNEDDILNNEIFDKTERLLNIKKEYKNVFEFDLLENINASSIIKELTSAEGFFNKLKVNVKFKKQLSKVIIKGNKISKKNIIKYYEVIEEYNDLNAFIKNNSNLLSKCINMNYYENIIELTKIKEKYSNSRQFINIIKKLDKDNILNAIEAFINIYNNKNQIINLEYTLCVEKLNSYIKEEALLKEKYLINVEMLNEVDNRYEMFLNLLIYCSNPNNFLDILNMSAINKITNMLNELGLKNIINLIITNKVSYKDFKEIYKLACANGYIKLYFKDEEINYFNASMFNSYIKKYKDLINEYNGLIIETVSHRLTKNLNHSSIDYVGSSPIGRLKKSIANNGRGVTIRDTLLNYDDIIRGYFPCFLMSPLSAAQYLAVSDEDGRSVSKFDIVIFDEASQIPTHKAVGPIARGNSLIVAGDPEQMPPTTYFNTTLNLDYEEMQYDDAVSLLDECLAIELPRIRLSYHYRSKHESLIDFSNHNFYNDSLYTFPSPNTTNSLVEFNYVELEKQKLNSNITKEEIEAICNKFREIYTTEETLNKSVGIVVFNVTQQEKVYDAISDMLLKDKVLNNNVEKALEKHNEPWFVKSLENVQGDERDIIILSIGFRKNSAGRAIVIGPIIRDNGQRRLNVAVSRSKEKMIVISTIRYVDFDEDYKIKNMGQLTLKKFLEYAQKGSYSNSDIRNSSNGVASLIKKDLENRGFKINENVGNSEFKVDLAIVGKDEKVYDLGILIDTKPIGENISLRDKYYVQESVLNSLKWKIINVYSLEYFKNKKDTIERIIAAIDDPYIKEDNSIHPNIVKEEMIRFSYNSIKYKKAINLPKISYDNELGFDYDVINLINEVIEIEGPVSFETIKLRVKENSNIQNMSEKAKNRLKNLLNSYEMQKTYDQTQEFFWQRDSNKAINVFRTNSNRDIYDIPKEEILEAMLQIIEVQGSISVEDLFKATLNAFEYDSSVLNKRNTNRLLYVYNWAKQTNKIK